MRHIAAVVFAGVLFFGAYGQVDTSKSKFWMMTYFINGSDYVGPRLAFTSDTTGAHWLKYNSETALFTPVTVTGANDSRCRDPMIAYDSISRKFHMIWTVSWTGTVIGWDTSSLLKNGTWGTQRGLAVGASITNCAFSWAPEIFWDDVQNQFMLYWSVSISGSTTRIYHSHVSNRNDFTTFERPAVMYNPGFDIIDADVIKVANGNYQMFFKDERSGYKYIRRAYGATVPSTGYTTYTNAVTITSGTSYAAEGPTVFRAGGMYRVIVDHYSNQGLGIVQSKNIDTVLSPWSGDDARRVYDGTGTTLMRVSHCNVIEVPKLLVKWMLYNDSSWVYYVRASGIRDVNWEPVMNINPATEIKVYDLSGRMVSFERILSGNCANVNKTAVRLPPGFYVTAAGNEKRARVNIRHDK